MKERPTATLPPDNGARGHEVGHGDRVGEPDSGKTKGFRFLYPSGSRPLEGYTIKRGLGHGGFGEVYFALSDFGKEVALKLIRRNYDVELRGIQQCLNLKHPHLLAIYDIRTDEVGDHWVIMEYVAGSSLDEVIRAHPQGMPPEQVCGWIQGIAGGLAYLHDRGIVHRDLKPSNIFCEDGVVKIGDYGLCKYITCSRRSGQTESVGTVHYMAPEIANGRYGKGVDIYALGVVLYEMLTGHVPFEGQTVGEVLMKHLTAQPDLSRVPAAFRPVVAKALEKDPEKRYHSVRDLMADLPQIGAAPPQGAEAVEIGPLSAGRPHGAFSRRPEEPLWRAFRELLYQLRCAWQRSNFDTPTKVILIIIGAFLLLATAQGWMPVLFVLGVVYLFYWTVRALVLRITGWHDVRPGLGRMGTLIARGGTAQMGSPTEAQAWEELTGFKVAESDPLRARQSQLPSWAPVLATGGVGARGVGNTSPRPLFTQEFFAELFGGLLLSAVASLIMACVMLIPYSFYHREIPPPEIACWLALTSMLAAWLVMVPGKIWGARPGDPATRRFVMMVLGLLLGLVAFGLAGVLELGLPPDPRFTESPTYTLPESFYDSDGTPRILAYLACFGSLFLLMRWWRQASPHRQVRLSLMSTVLSMLVGWLVAAVWLFPQPWVAMVACTASVAVQLASPWRNPQRG